MAETVGVLLHVYHLEAQNWRELLLGDVARNKRGSLATLAQLIASYPLETQWKILLYSGPSMKDKKNESEYTYAQIIDSLGTLDSFDFFSELSDSSKNYILDQVKSIECMGLIKNTSDEVAQAALQFRDYGITEVFQIACASHAPRCLQAQLRCREDGQLPAGQLWCVLGSDVCFGDSSPTDTVIVEPLHRGDDPLVRFRPGLNEVVKPYFSLSSDAKKEFILKSNELMLSLCEPHDEINKEIR